ncbi:SDR family NAD(P)-dependent oxidoreductase [Rhodococcus koreensis]|uniref:SDR family NAD(P)-dependent oxidoreductase n=1 Tax=Rhodococcus koreensis TaxID=99653 RepID=UPI00367074C7
MSTSSESSTRCTPSSSLIKTNPDGGHIVNTSSMSGLIAMPAMDSYTASKFGVVGLTEVLAAELAEDGGAIGATVLCPGPVRSTIKNSLRSRHQGERGGLLVVRCRRIDGRPAGLHALDGIGRVRTPYRRCHRANDLDVITHPELWPMVQPRLNRIRTAFTASAPANH